MRVPLIETARLLLRPFLTTDAAARFAYAAASEFSQYVEYLSLEQRLMTRTRYSK